MGFGRFLRRQRSELERAEELESYLQIDADQNIRDGMSPEQAWDLARRKLGNITHVREQIYEFNTILSLETCWRNLRLAFRSLRRQPAFTAAAVLTLALGIGANTAIFSMADALLLRPLPVPDPQGIVAVDTLASRLTRFGNSSFLDYQDVLRRSKSFESLAVFQSLTLGMNPDPSSPASKVEAANGLLVSGNFFSCFGIVPVVGRAFRPDEDVAQGRSPAAVISYALWQRKFGLSPNVIGRRVGLNGHLFTVVGVAPKSFTGPDLFSQPDIYVPLMMVGQLHSRGTHPLTQRSWRGFSVRGRLRRGVTLPQVQAELDAIMRDLEREHPETNKDNVMVVRREIDRRFAQDAAVPGLLMALVSLVLLIACANLANLMMANATARLKEISTQLAIGASRGRILAQILTESTLLAGLGAASGIALAFACVRGIRGILPLSDTLEGPDLRLDNRVLAYTLLVSAIAVLLYGVAPAWAAIRESWNAVIHNRSALSGSRMLGLIARRLLIGGQVALCTVLLIVGALFLKAFENAESTDLGFDANNLLLMTLDPHLAGYSDQRAVPFYKELLQAAGAIHGVSNVSMAFSVPFRGGAGWALAVDGYTAPGGEKWLEVATDRVTPNYFRTMRIPLLAGRDFTPRDNSKAPPVAVVNEKFARRYIIGKANLSTALGRFIQLRDSARIQIVGIVKDSIFEEIGRPPDPIFYLSADQDLPPRMTLEVRCERDPAGVASALRAKLRAIDPQIVPVSLLLMSDAVAANGMFVPRILTLLSAGFALVALLLAVVGLYGVVSFMVSRRTREIGLRMALGARRRSVLAMVMGTGLSTAAVGLMLGLAGALLLTPLLQQFLLGVNPRDPLAFLSIAAVLLTATAAACWMPAHRAASIDPLTALRHE